MLDTTPFQHTHSHAAFASATAPLVVPPLYRVQAIVRLPTPDGLILNRATLYHDDAHFSTQWVTQHPDVRITRGSLVSVVWLGPTSDVKKPASICRLVLSERPRPEIDLFATVPPNWVKDRALLKRASRLFEGLPRAFRHLFNAMFWEGERFLRYVMGPSSLAPDQCHASGNFRHCVEVAEEAQRLARARGKAQAPIAVLGGLIHDAGKADEFDYDKLRRRFELSEAGRWISHRDRLQHWIAAALAAHRVIMPDAHRLQLLHALTAAYGAPEWLGMREPRSLEASLLSMSDRFSENNSHEPPAANQPGYAYPYRRSKGNTD